MPAADRYGVVGGAVVRSGVGVGAAATGRGASNSAAPFLGPALAASGASTPAANRNLTTNPNAARLSVDGSDYAEIAKNRIPL